MIYVCSLNDGHTASSEGARILKTIEDVYQIILNRETREIIMEDEFIEKHFTPSGFTSFVKECKRINKFLDVIYNPQYTSCFNDGVKNLKKVEDAGSKLSNMLLELSEARYLREQEIRGHDITRNKLAKAAAELEEMLSGINGIAVGMEKFPGVWVSSNSYKKILYVKEITRVHFVDTLLYYLQEIIKNVQAVQTRFMVIEPPYADCRIALYPRCKSYCDLTNGDAVGQDVFMAGFQAYLMEDVLNNPSKAAYLIILDRSGYEDVYVNGNGVETLYTVSDLEDVKFNVLLNRLISYSPQTLHIPFIKDFSELMSEDKVHKYYSMNITKVILELLERKD